MFFYALFLSPRGLNPTIKQKNCKGKCTYEKKQKNAMLNGGLVSSMAA